MGAGLLAAAASFSCVDEEIVFRDRVLFEDPATAAMGMLGYTDRAAKLTVCGNCHVGQQNQWEESAHADAWAGLQDSGHAQAFCEGCHTVNELGNELDEPAGHLAIAEERYYDVQCESCHGPGLAHVTNPDADSKPMASLSAGADLTTGCGECHSGAHHPFVDEWEMSRHAQTTGFAAARDGCSSCHEGKNALLAMGVNAEYVEAGSSEIMPITCAVCHDPHDATYTAQLRFPVETPNVRQHLCAQCHDRSTEPNPASSHGLHPHAPETALLEGDVGWFPPGLEINRGRIIGTHGTEANPGLCATCHVSSFEVTDDDGVFIQTATGHVFNAIPCLDEDGTPTAGDCDLTLEERTFEGCTGGACHGTEQAAFSALTSAATRLEFLAEELFGLLLVVDPNGEEPGGEIDATDGIFTVAEGAFFNYALAEFGGTDRPSPLLAFTGASAHNPFLTEQLLIASIRAVENEYDVQASAGLVRTPQLTRPATR